MDLYAERMLTEGARLSAEARAAAMGPMTAEAGARSNGVRRLYWTAAASGFSLVTGMIFLSRLLEPSPHWTIYLATVGFLSAGALGLTRLHGALGTRDEARRSRTSTREL